MIIAVLISKSAVQYMKYFIYHFTIHYLTIILQARMGAELIAHEAEWTIDSEAIRARGIIVLVKI